jgi:tRNA nucleotidyltransferase/poly(A) polymerase
MFEVGGCVRDEILGVPSKDIDFTVVLDDEFAEDGFNRQGNTPFEAMTLNLRKMGFKIFLETPEFLTVRAQFPETYEHKGFDPVSNRWVSEPRKGITADFVLARREAEYTDGRRPDKVIPGTLEDDLARRDFTMNAIAKAADGSYIDPFNGLADIDARIIRAVGDPVERLAEDALRAVRALRFSVTKGFHIELGLRFAMQDDAVLDAIVNKISDERIQQELSKMFRFDSRASIRAMFGFGLLTDAVFAGSVSLDATMKTRGRGKK